MTFSIDQDSCTRCGECKAECPSLSITRLQGGAYTIDAESCIRCSHCAAVCPADAVRSDAGVFRPWEDPGLDPQAVAELLRGKRSIRRYSKREIDPALVEEVLLTGSLCSTASNAQDCTATVLTGAKLRELREGASAIFAHTAALVRNPLLRFFLRFTEARRYVVRPRTLAGLDRLASSAQGPDRLFFDAPVVVILSAPRRHRRFGPTDCVLAGAHMMLHAQAAGLGSCAIGFAEVAMRTRPALALRAGVPPQNRVSLVFTLGYPEVRYYRLPIRARIGGGAPSAP